MAASAPGYYNGHVPERAIDGILEFTATYPSIWHAPTTGTHLWIQLDLGRTRCVAEVEFFTLAPFQYRLNEMEVCSL